VQVVPVTRELPIAAEKMQALLPPYSFTSFDLALDHKVVF
jgi:alpha-N-arabinofuranosidase